MVRKISVCGKGGSGKSTIVALMAQELRRRDHQVLVVDSDESNIGLYRTLGFDRPPKPLLELAGGKKNVQRFMRSSPATGEEVSGMSVLRRENIRIAEIPTAFIVSQDGLSLVAVGKILQASEGCACPMGLLTREFLRRLRLREQEVTLVDMEAGIEHFGRGVQTSVDAVIAIVEPSLESLDLGAKMRQLAKGAGARFAGVITNKITSGELEQWLNSELKNRLLPVLGTIHYHPEIAQAGLRGQPPVSAESQSEIGTVVDALINSDDSV